MKRCHIIARLSLLLMFVLSGPVGMAGVSSVVAQGTSSDGDSYVSELTGLEVEASGQFSITDTIVEDGYEDIRIESDFGLLTVTAFEGEADAAETRDAYLEGFATEMDSMEEIESDEPAGEAWSLSIADASGVEMGVYAHVYEDYIDGFVMLFIAAVPTGLFEDVMLEAQDDILIDGESMFADVDVDELVGYLEESSGGVTGGDDEATVETDDDNPVGDDDATIEADDNAQEDDTARTGARLPDEDADELEDADRDSTGDEEKTSTGDTGLEDSGLISDNEYESPQFGITIEWDNIWFVDTNDDSSVVSDEEGLFDTLMLVWDGTGDGLMWIDLTTTDDLTPEDMVDYWISDEYMEEFADPDAEILLDDSDEVSGSVLYRDYLSDGEEVIILMEATMLEDEEHMSIVTIMSYTDEFVDVVDDASAGVSVDGGDVVNTFRVRDIENAIEE